MGTAVPLLTARVWVLCGGDGAVSMGTGCLSAGVGVRRGVAGSLSNWVGVTPTMRLYLPRVEARLRGIIALKAYVAS